MATIKIDEHGTVTVTMANGTVIPVPADYKAISIHSRAEPYLITFADGAEWWFTNYQPEVIYGLAGDIEDGETFTPEDEGCTWTRYGDEMLSTAPGQQLKQAA
jgi:hypothetical protein